MYRKIKILIVEDNELNLKIVSFWLSKSNIFHKTSFTGEEAFEIFNKEWFDVIIMDLMLPGITGFETTRLIRKTGTEIYGRQPLIIALTANTLDNDRGRCLREGMDEYLCKPFEIKKLKDIMENRFNSKNEMHL